MKKQVTAIMALCAASLVLAAQGQTSSSDSSSSGLDKSSSDKSIGSSSRHYSPTGRMGHTEIKGSQLNGSSVQSSSGQSIGTINDFVVNPGSGKIDFAILSYNENSSTRSGNTTSDSTSASSSRNTSAGDSGTLSSSDTAGATRAFGKQIAVPWALLRPSSSSGSSGYSGSSTSGSTSRLSQQTFVFSGDTSKLQSAPAFEDSTDLTQPGWRQSVFSYFGVSGASTGGSESYGGTSSGSSSSSTDNQK